MLKNPMLRFTVVLLWATIGLINFSFAQDSFKYEKQIEALVQPYLEHKKFQAASIGVVLGGKVWTRHYGQLAPDNKTLPNNDTLYEIGSITKVFTSLLLADAIENSDDIELEDSIGKLLPIIAKKNPDLASTVTLQQLATHTSGLPRMPDNCIPEDSNDPFAGYKRTQLHTFLENLVYKKIDEPKYEYSNLGAGLLGDMLAQRAGMDYSALLTSRILKPLEMNQTSTDVVGERLKNLAPPFNSALLPDYSYHFDALAGAGSIRSSITDMLKFMQANIHPPNNEVGKAIKFAWEPRLPASAEHLAMGLGWMIAGDQSTRWHNGRTGGYQSMMLVSRELDAGVILLCNTAGSESDGLAETVFQTVVGMKIEPRKFEKTVEVDPAVIKRLEGKYKLLPGVEFTVFSNDSRMMAQLTGQQALRIDPASDTVWNYRDVEAKLEFELPEKGEATKVTLFQNGGELTAHRIK